MLTRFEKRKVVNMHFDLLTSIMSYFLGFYNCLKGQNIAYFAFLIPRWILLPPFCNKIGFSNNYRTISNNHHFLHLSSVLEQLAFKENVCWLNQCTYPGCDSIQLCKMLSLGVLGEGYIGSCGIISYGIWPLLCPISMMALM